MDKEKFEPIGTLQLEEMADGSEIFWEKKIDIFEDQNKEILKNGKIKKIKQRIFKGFKYEVYRTKLSKFHHKTVSGYLPCLVEDPNGEFPYPTPWADNWTYAGNGVFYTMWRRRK